MEMEMEMEMEEKEKEKEKGKGKGKAQDEAMIVMKAKDEAAIIASASHQAAQELEHILHKSDVEELRRLQLLVLGRLQDSNAVLSYLNDFSERSFAAVANDFSKNTKLVKSMKEDLDYIFTRIRSLKARLSARYPNAFKSEMPDERPDLEAPVLKL